MNPSSLFFPKPESLKKYYQTKQYMSYTSAPKTTFEKAYVFIRKIRIAIIRPNKPNSGSNNRRR